MNAKLLLWIVFASVLACAVSSDNSYYLDLDSLPPHDPAFDLGALQPHTESQATLDIDLRYGQSSLDGKTHEKGIIELHPSLEYAAPELSEDHYCTRWEVYSIDNKRSEVICHGDSGCCSHLNLVSSRSTWDAPLYLSLAKYGTTSSNLVSAQLVHVDQGSPLFSAWVQKDAEFVASVSNQKTILHDEIKISKSFQKKSPDLYSTQSSDTIDVYLENLNTQISDEDINNIIVETTNQQLENQAAAQGIQPLHSVRVHINSIDQEAYTGKITIPFSTPVNTVLFCPDDTMSSCTSFSPCKHSRSSCYEMAEGVITVYTPHYSSVLLGFQNNTINLSIHSPDNTSTLSSGEVLLNLSTNATITLNYSLNGQSIQQLGSGQQFSSSLVGDLTYGVLSNGQHTLEFGVDNLAQEYSTLVHSFVVDDNNPPELTLNITNNSLITGDALALTIQLQTDEYANYSYSFNQGSFTPTQDIGVSKSTMVSLNPRHGNNTLDISVIDLHGNSQTAYYVFEYHFAGHCSDGLQNGDETDLDCGGSCSSCIPFTSSTDKPTYNTTDPVLLSIQAREHSHVNVTVRRDGVIVWQQQFLPAFEGAPIAQTTTVGSTDIVGTYSITADLGYLNTTQQLTTGFSVLELPTGSLSVSISTNATSIDEDDTVSLIASVSGGSGALSYAWDYNMDGVVDNTLSELSYKFGRNGTHRVNLTVSDDETSVSSTRTFSVAKTYNLTVIVIDNSTQDAVDNVTIDVDGDRYLSNAEGRQIIDLEIGSYTVKLSHENFSSEQYSVNLDKSLTIYANLSGVDVSPPVVTLLSPINNQTVVNQTVNFLFRAFDHSTITCTLYTRADGVLWKTQQSSTITSPDGEYAIAATLEEGNYEWRIECRDTRGNTQSQSSSVIIDLDAVVPEQVITLSTDHESRIQEIETLIARSVNSLEGLDTNQKRIAEYIDFKKTLDKALTEIKRARRDLNSLEWRKLNDTELQKETDKINARIEQLYENTPSSLSVVNSQEYVDYPSREDIGIATPYLVNRSNAKLSKRQEEKFIEDNFELQSQLTVTTQIHHVDIEYISSQVKPHTVVRKLVDHTIDDFASYTFFEIIPKDMASHVNAIIPFFEYTVVDPDPVLEVSIEDYDTLTYLVPEHISTTTAEAGSSLLLYQEVDDSTTNYITGFSIIDSFTTGLVDTIDFRLFIEIIIVLVLLVIYIIYSVGSVEKVMHIFDSKDLKEITKILELINDHIYNRDYKKAKEKYKNLLTHYRGLKSKERLRLKHDITAVTNNLNVLYINNLLADADTIAGKKDRAQMKTIYHKIRSLYSIIPREHKQKVSQKCMMLHHALAEQPKKVQGTIKLT